LISVLTDLYVSHSFVFDIALHMCVRCTGCCAGEHASECRCDVGCGI